jgi:hypothetical protein
LKSECYIKFLEVVNKGYLDREKGRPFTYLTSSFRFHMIALRKQNQKTKHQLESNYFENEEYIYNESDHEDVSFDEFEIEDEEMNYGAIYYDKIIELLERDIKNETFSSSKEAIFADQLVKVMRTLPKLSFQNKFFVKFMLGELTASSGIEMKRFTINYYLLKF